MAITVTVIGGPAVRQRLAGRGPAGDAAHERGLEATILDSPAYGRYAERRRRDGAGR